MTKFFNFIFILLLVSTCNDNISSSSSVDTDTTRYAMKITDTLQIEIDIKSEEVKRLEDVKAQFKLKNISGEVVVYGFSSGCQYGFTVTKNQDTIFDSRENLVCTAAMTGLKLEPDQTKTFPISFERFDINKKLKEGIYELNAFLLEGQTPKISAFFKVE